MRVPGRPAWWWWRHFKDIVRASTTEWREKGNHTAKGFSNSARNVTSREGAFWAPSQYSTRWSIGTIRHYRTPAAGRGRNIPTHWRLVMPNIVITIAITSSVTWIFNRTVKIINDLLAKKATSTLRRRHTLGKRVTVLAALLCWPVL
jgi:hypothetical protein